jgi:hypothetical protein
MFIAALLIIVPYSKQMFLIGELSNKTDINITQNRIQQ